MKDHKDALFDQAIVKALTLYSEKILNDLEQESVMQILRNNLENSHVPSTCKPLQRGTSNNPFREFFSKAPDRVVSFLIVIKELKFRYYELSLFIPFSFPDELLEC
jgi:hypothetical protein